MTREAGAGRCAACAYYYERDAWWGKCRRYPPTIDGQWRTAPSNERVRTLGVFPMVEANWLCGEYAPIPAPGLDGEGGSDDD